jgi:hypothetical protein
MYDVPQLLIFSTGCDVHTAMTLAPDATPALIPLGLSSTTRQFFGS